MLKVVRHGGEGLENAGKAEQDFQEVTDLRFNSGFQVGQTAQSISISLLHSTFFSGTSLLGFKPFNNRIVLRRLLPRVCLKLHVCKIWIRVVHQRILTQITRVN